MAISVERSTPSAPPPVWISMPDGPFQETFPWNWLWGVVTPVLHREWGPLFAWRWAALPTGLLSLHPRYFAKQDGPWPTFVVVRNSKRPPSKYHDGAGMRSEERRVGKECRSRWS